MLYFDPSFSLVFHFCSEHFSSAYTSCFTVLRLMEMPHAFMHLVNDTGPNSIPLPKGGGNCAANNSQAHLRDLENKVKQTELQAILLCYSNMTDGHKALWTHIMTQLVLQHPLAINQSSCLVWNCKALLFTHSGRLGLELLTWRAKWSYDILILRHGCLL